MVKHNLVIASVLKPIDDTRMYEKFGITLSSLPNYHIHVVGFQSEKLPVHPNISFHPLFDFSRLALKRFLAPLKYYRLLAKVKPKIIIVNSPDLLIVTTIYKTLFGAVMLYDVQENYYYNLLYANVFTAPVKQILAALIRAIECICAPAVSHFFLAEKTYRNELPFIGSRFTIIENKYNPIHDLKLSDVKGRGIHHLLYSGTIAESYGVFDAINLVKKLYSIDPRFHLTIIGYCAKSEDYLLLVEAIQGYSYINLIGGRTMVPHSEIIKAISKADVALVCYKDNKSTRYRIPTKFYEYIYHQLPMLIPKNHVWVQFCSLYNAALPVDFQNLPLDIVYTTLQQKVFYNADIDFTPVLWDMEAILLIDVIRSINIS